VVQSIRAFSYLIEIEKKPGSVAIRAARQSAELRMSIVTDNV